MPGSIRPLDAKTEFRRRLPQAAGDHVDDRGDGVDQHQAMGRAGGRQFPPRGRDPASGSASRSRFPALLASHDPVVSRVRTPIGRRGVYAVRIGVDDRAEANVICQKLQSVGGPAWWCATVRMVVGMDESCLQQDRLYDDPDLVQFYDLENEGGADFDACLSFAEGARSVLDLGCGTGQLAAALGEGRRVTGVDPAAAMLDVARNRPGGESVDWVKADARTVRLDRQFDLVLLTGHAFQVFLTPGDQAAVLRTIAFHLAPGGRFIFDTRNPNAEEWRQWTPEASGRRLEHPHLGRVEAWNDVERDAATGIVTYA